MSILEIPLEKFPDFDQNRLGNLSAQAALQRAFRLISLFYFHINSPVELSAPHNGTDVGSKW